MKLPVKLAKEPLVELLFEVRFKARLPASAMLPGLLFATLPGEKSLERLPAADLPEAVRRADVNLAYAPLLRIHWSKYAILIGDRNLSLSIKLPYPGWSEFKPSIVLMLEVLSKANVVESIERCAIKSVDVIWQDLGSVSQIVDCDFRLGSHDLAQLLFHMRCEVVDGNTLHIVQVASEGSGSFLGKERTGAVVDIDTIAAVSGPLSIEGFMETIPERLDELHDKNKAMFFGFIRQKALAKLEPVYD